jgi:hypothetical protein
MSRQTMALLVVASFVGATRLPARAEAAPPDTAPHILVPVAFPPPLQRPSPPPPALPAVTTVHRRRTGPLVGGAVLFGLTWGGAVFLSAALLHCACTHPDMALEFAVPILGPVMAGPPADGSIWYVWSAAQLGGAILLGYGLKGEDVPVTGDVPPTRTGWSRPPELQLAPMLARDARGMTLTARW